MSKKLAVFDFDHTIVDDNSDIVVRKLLRNDQIPEKVRTMYRRNGWTAYMQEIFHLLHKNNIGEREIRNAVIKIPAVSHIPNLIKTLGDKLNFDIIVISDSNSIFINDWLANQSLSKYVAKVFTNPAQYDKHGLLKIKMYHVQKECSLSTINLCKGKIMQDYVEAQGKVGVKYDRIVYVGDGKNDFCPIIRLQQGDLACVRVGYPCVDLVKKNLTEEAEHKVTSKVCIWNTGEDILRALEEKA